MLEGSIKAGLNIFTIHANEEMWRYSAGLQTMLPLISKKNRHGEWFLNAWLTEWKGAMRYDAKDHHDVYPSTKSLRKPTTLPFLPSFHPSQPNTTPPRQSHLREGQLWRMKHWPTIFSLWMLLSCGQQWMCNMIYIDTSFNFALPWTFKCGDKHSPNINRH